MVYTDTIAAIATALSSSGIGIIRISGSDAVAVAERMFEPGGGGEEAFGAENVYDSLWDIFGMERNGSMKCCFF